MSLEPFEVRVEDGDGHHRVAVAGELDAASAQRLRSLLSELVGQGSGGLRDVVVDLRRVPFMDSTGLGALIKTASQLRRQERHFCVVNPQPQVLAVFEATGLMSLVGDDRAQNKA